jgi:hypothetical protein
MVARVKGFVEGFQPLVLLFQSSELVPKVPLNVKVRVSMVDPVLLTIRNCIGVPPKLGR